ncbi:MAG: hypothetical protein A3D16_06935 [Rhodobacterales bacterium RIFCSPHIGHO2_02_FULL_62_130]|jgi:Flp pilus assembly pilin Flp|nr:MAG: hypothetical protein A3D16_06935 [Rhodobacterales bacterium RIFCSPHIGHO2_02_FULL_62_130]OHC57191.1 MAG: hypothetical protein A3E48_04815 [Rhodobacterales bacterium RIFCSPHIGHO2_12_FULL_62_75]HCZ01333.1 hypothetical protein [Rhodobacter sp.]
MTTELTNFLTDEDGAVTIDWVVLSAAVIGMGMLVLYPVAFSAESSSQGISDSISARGVGYVSTR